MAATATATRRHLDRDGREIRPAMVLLHITGHWLGAEEARALALELLAAADAAAVANRELAVAP